MTLPPVAGPATNSVAVVDAMVVYTAAARESAGGESQIQSLIHVAVAEANTVYQNSRANVRLHLVYSGEIDYTEHSSITTNLTRLQSATDGFMDDVHEARERNRADVVCLITETADEGVAGYAFTMGEPSIFFKPLAFCVVKRSELAGTYTFAHEIGHVLGCQHDVENSFEEDGTFKPGAFPYSHAHRFNVGTNIYRTVMAHSPGEPIPFFSNPDMMFLDVPLGVHGTTNGANNTLTLNLTAPLVSSFYGPATQTLTPLVSIAGLTNGSVFRAGTELAITISAADLDGEVRQIEMFAGNRLIGRASDPLTAEIIVPISTDQPKLTNLTYSIAWSNPPNGEFKLSARAIDNRGASSISLPVSVIMRPANDSFVDRVVLSEPEPAISASNLAGTIEPGEAMHGSNPGGSSVWYSWKAPRSGTVIASAIGDRILPLTEVYKSLTSTTLTTITKIFEFDQTNLTSRAWFDAVTGETYAIAVDAAQGRGGSFDFSLQYQPPPPNDLFVNRELLVGESVRLEADNRTAGTEDNEPTHAAPNPSGKSLWYQWSPPRPTTATLTVTGNGFFPLLDVYVGGSMQLLTNVPGRTIDFDVASNVSTLTFDAVPEQEYAIAIAGFAGTSGSFVLNLEIPPPPRNDNFADRIVISGSTVALEVSNRYASVEPGEPAQHAGQNANRSIWFSWIAPVSGPVSIAAKATGFYPLPEVYTGEALGQLAYVPGRMVDFDTNIVSTLTFDAVALRTYHIAIDAFSSSGGKINLTLTTANTPPEVATVASTGGVFSLTIRGTASQGYLIEQSTNLIEWTELFRGTFSSNTAQFDDSSAAAMDTRFYRVLPVP